MAPLRLIAGVRSAEQHSAQGFKCRYQKAFSDDVQYLSPHQNLINNCMLASFHKLQNRSIEYEENYPRSGNRPARNHCRR